MTVEETHVRRGPASWLAMALGALLVLIGVVLTIGGAWLLLLGGSAYYVLAGLGLIVLCGRLVSCSICFAWV